MVLDDGRQKRTTFDNDFPAINNDSLRCFKQRDIIYPEVKNNVQRGSIYSTLPDQSPLEGRIVNEQKPQITLRYLTIRGKQYSLQLAQKAASSVKRRKLAPNIKT
jgi:hypothetical protein